jgi:hypothetical protein
LKTRFRLRWLRTFGAAIPEPHATQGLGGGEDAKIGSDGHFRHCSGNEMGKENFVAKALSALVIQRSVVRYYTVRKYLDS